LDKPNLVYIENNGIVDFNPEDRIIAKINLANAQNVIVCSSVNYIDYYDVDGVRYDTGTTQISLSAGEHIIKYKHNSDLVFTTNVISSLPNVITLIIPEGIKTVNMQFVPTFNVDTDGNSITFPESIERILGTKSYGQNSSVVCKAKTPPLLNDAQGGYTFYVPSESVDLYKAAEYWASVRDYILPIEASEL
jgi:hypothetical protein